MPQDIKHWLVVPAGGSGQRLGSEVPKQFLNARNGKSILELSIDALCNHHLFSGVVVAAGPFLPVLNYIKAEPGVSRSQSVLNGVMALKDAGSNDWVWVHDAVRPCVSQDEVLSLAQALQSNNSVGAILAEPIPATVKEVQDKRIKKTLDRSCLWLAQTPQVFRKSLLEEALVTAHQKNKYPTDEAEAVEWLGHQPLVVAGKRTNIKITYPEDLTLLNGWLPA